jgi:hypothetical protein
MKWAVAIVSTITAEKTAFLKFELENGDDRRIKRALQDVSGLYRRGFQLNAEGRNAFQKLINGMVLSQRDLKVVRWCLNALARLGTSESTRYIELSLKQHEDKPEIVAAAVAALSRLHNGNLIAVPCLKTVDPAIQTLAALQTTDSKKLNLSNFKINIDKSDVEVLKLALITVGLNKDIDNLFDPRHSNGQIVKILCQHEDNIVRQYCVWAVIENKKLNIQDLGISFSEIGKEPPNVQAKLLQLIAEQEPNYKLRHQIISDGSFNEHSEAREGMAKGLVYMYYDGLEEITIDWFNNEENAPVKGLLAEHFGRFSETCRPYEDKAIAIVEAEPTLKSRILLGAEGKRLYGAIKASDIREGTPDLFGNSFNLADLAGKQRLIKIGRKKMKVLFLAASPLDQDSLRLDKEARDLREQLMLVQDRKIDLKIEHRWAVRTDQVQMEMLNHQPQILHFSGHGSVGELIFEDTFGNTAPVSAAVIAELISLCKGVRCLLLNACFSESIANLIGPPVEAVIGCDESIDDDAASGFSRAFYRALAHGHDYEIAYRLAKNDLRLNGFEKEARKYLFRSC